MAAGDAASELSSTPRGSNYASSPGPRIRSRVACQGCNRRKVRCDVAQTGPPCSNCQHDKASCEVLPRKKHRPRRTRDSLPTEQSAVQYEGSLSHSRAGQSNPSIQREESTLGAYSGTALFQEPPVAAVRPIPGSLENEAVGIEHSNNRPTASALEGDAILPDDSSFSYIGDKRGPRQSVYDLCHPGTPQEARPYLPMRAPSISHKPHEVEYMRHQGIFAVLPDDVCDELIRCYFQHVHFFLPVIDAASFLNEYISNGSQSMNPLLFWSMLLAAANFAEAGVLQRAGFSSRKAMKAAMYERAKCLYDLDRGTDKLILIQSVLLLGFWYTDPQDHTGAWYWIGIAISLSQSIGLHRSPRSTSRTQQPSQARQSLMRRIWWTCLVRDRWVSLAKGRPMRIHSEDCDSPWPVAQDILDELESVSILAREKFIPVDSGNLAKMWIQLVSISDILGGILRLHYRANGPAPCIRDIDRYAEELQDCLQEDFCSDDMSDILRGQAYQLGLFHQAAVAILYRPYVLNESASLPSDAHPSWLRTATRRAREAASSTNSLLENLIEVNAIKFLKPMIITALIPAMQIHLFDCKSTNPLICGLGSNKLQLCMLVLSNLRETYWSAGVMYRLFEKAQMILGNSNPELARAARGTASGNNRTTSQNRNQNYVNPPLDQLHGHQESEISMLLTPEPNLPLNEQPAPSWFNTSPRFSNVDQLLSPGFSLSENVFQDLFPDYDGGMVYDPIVPVSNGISEDMLYNI